MKKAVYVILAVTFVCCLYCVNADGSITQRFSFEVWINNLIQISDSVSIEDLSDCWTEEGYYEHYEVNDAATAHRYVLYESYEGSNDILIWLDGIVGFFKRLFQTIKLVVKMITQVFGNLRLLLPWNATTTA